MEDKNLKLWQVIVSLATLGLVIGSMIYWLYGNTGKEEGLKSQNAELKEMIAELEEKQVSLEEENRRLKSMPAQEIVVEKECPPCPEYKADKLFSKTAPQKKCEDSKERFAEFGLGKPVSMATMVCTKMATGKWDIPKTCEKELKKFVGGKLDENGNFFVITPIVDTLRYKGKQPELKQAGLGQFRAKRVKRSIHEAVGPNIAIFQKNVIQKKDMRGFIIELYQVESYK